MDVIAETRDRAARSLRYIVITSDGELVERSRAGRPRDLINMEVGEPGNVLVAPSRGDLLLLGIFVNDTGHVQGLRRNVIGTCMAASITGRPLTPLAGPVVITGWDWLGDDTESCSLTDDEAVMVRRVHADLRTLLGQEQGILSADASPGWRESMRALAEHTKTAPTPRIEILTGDDALRMLGGEPTP